MEAIGKRYRDVLDQHVCGCWSRRISSLFEKEICFRDATSRRAEFGKKYARLMLRGSRRAVGPSKVLLLLLLIDGGVLLSLGWLPSLPFPLGWKVSD